MGIISLQRIEGGIRGSARLPVFFLAVLSGLVQQLRIPL